MDVYIFSQRMNTDKTPKHKVALKLVIILIIKFISHAINMPLLA